MGRPRQISDEQILDAARACFLEHGPQVSTQTVAERLDVSQAALFKRFRTKEDLLVAALSPPAVPPFIPLVERGPDERAIPAQLAEIAGEILAFFREIIPRISILRASGIDVERYCFREQPPPPIRSQQALAAWLSRAQAQGRIRPLDTHAAALAFLGTLQARVFFAHIAAEAVCEERAQEYLKTMVDLLCFGLIPAAGLSSPAPLLIGETE